MRSGICILYTISGRRREQQWGSTSLVYCPYDRCLGWSDHRSFGAKEFRASLLWESHLVAGSGYLLCIHRICHRFQSDQYGDRSTHGRTEWSYYTAFATRFGRFINSQLRKLATLYLNKKSSIYSLSLSIYMYLIYSLSCFEFMICFCKPFKKAAENKIISPLPHTHAPLKTNYERIV